MGPWQCTARTIMAREVTTSGHIDHLYQSPEICNRYPYQGQWDQWNSQLRDAGGGASRTNLQIKYVQRYVQDTIMIMEEINRPHHRFPD